ncbi:MAG TPA: tRNA-intron lyase [Methanomassiliicoccales archaeon]|nr:tRNA-intron lyase [Methanomassiliicoccales archaeon]
MAGELVGDSVVIKDQAEASQIYNKGFYGYPQSGGGLELDLLEAIFLMEADRLVVQRQGENVRLEELLHAASEHCEGFEILYIVYRDLRQRGYVVKSDAGEFDFRVFPRGGTPSNAPTKYYVLAISERAACVMRDLFEEADRSEKTRKELLLAVVDEEGDLTYYRASTGAPHGNPLAVPTTEVGASLFEDRVMVMDEAKGAELYSQGFFGKKIGKTLQLSLIETAYLMEQGVIDIHYPVSGKRMTLGAFRKKAAEIQPDFELRLRAYEDLRKRGLVVKTGFKYGSHFRVYDGSPDGHHSKYLVHAVHWDYRTIWPEISRAVRLAHGVKKDILFARVTKKQVDYLRLRRVRP